MTLCGVVGVMAMMIRGGSFMIWPNGEEQDEQARSLQERAARLQLAQLAGSVDGIDDLVALPLHEAPTRRPRQCLLQ
jgi:hypothetical protein